MTTEKSSCSSQCTEISSIVDEYIESLHSRSPNYRKNARSVLDDWVEFSSQKSDRVCIENVIPRDIAQYAEWLSKRVESGKAKHDDGIAASTAWTYYSHISSFLSWCVRWDYIDTNPAKSGKAKERMPNRPKKNDYDRQYWSSEQRSALLDYIQQEIYEAFRPPISDITDRYKWMRNAALVSVIGYTGVRGGEVLRDPVDSRRDGLRWNDVDTDRCQLLVLGKSQSKERVPLPDQAVEYLVDWKEVLDPPHDGWPVFPSLHKPTIVRAIKNEVDEESFVEYRQSNEDKTYVDIASELDATLPAMTTEGGRSTLKRLSNKADIPNLGEDEYLTLHGARRGVGHYLYTNHGAERAQQTLRHTSPAITSRSYTSVDIEDLANQNTEAFDSD